MLCSASTSAQSREATPEYSYLYTQLIGQFGQKVLDVSFSLSQGWWYFISVCYFTSPVCLSQKMTKLQVVCLEFVLVVHPFMLIFLTWLCIEPHARDFSLCFTSHRRRNREGTGGTCPPNFSLSATLTQELAILVVSSTIFSKFL